MKKFIHCIYILLVSSISLVAQSEVITGRVSDEIGPLQGAVVVYISKDTPNNLYSVTDFNGRFSLKLKTKPTSRDSLSISMLGYQSTTIPLNRLENIEIVLKTSVINIKEVVVQAPKVKEIGDTILYNVKSFVESQDKSISDVLKRMPGIEIRENGTIMYNGEPIGNLYVEGTDIIGGRYSLLTKNINAHDIKRVEVIQNDQPIKALVGSGTDLKPSLNLVLRDKSKGKWIGTANIGAGVTSTHSVLWDDNLFLMRVGNKWSSINNLKTNNVGTNLSQELKTIGSSNRVVKDKTDYYISVGITNAPLKDYRVRFNNSVLFNTSNSWKLKNKWKANASLNYYFDRIESDNNSSTTYYFNNGQQTILEERSSLNRSHSLNGQVSIEANREYYFSNVLSFEGALRDATQNLHGLYQNKQSADLPHFLIKDDIKYIKRRGRGTITIESFNDYLQYNQTLIIQRENNRQIQKVDVKSFNTKSLISYEHKIYDRTTIGIKSGIDVTSRLLESSLNGLDIDTIPNSMLSNYENVGFAKMYITPRLDYRSQNFEVGVAIPIGWSHFWGLNTSNYTYRATGAIRYSPIPKITIELTGAASSNDLNIDKLYSGYILRNYRYLSKGTQNTNQDKYYTIIGRIQYKNPIKLLFIDARVSKNWNMFPTIQSQDFLGNYIILSMDDYPSNTESLVASLSGNVGINGINGKVGATIAYRDISSSTIQNSLLTPHLSQTISFSPYFMGTFMEWIGVEYKLLFSHNILTISNSGLTDSKNSFNHTITLNFKPSQNTDLKLTAEHYYTVLANNNAKNTILFDASFLYRLKNGIELNISALNLLNQKTYSYSIFYDLQDFSCEYTIRPFNITTGIYFRF